MKWKRFLNGLIVGGMLALNIPSGYCANVQHAALTDAELHTAYPNGTDPAATYDAAPDVGDWYWETDAGILSYCFVDNTWLGVSFAEGLYSIEGVLQAAIDSTGFHLVAATEEDLVDMKEKDLSGCYLYRVDDDTCGVTAGTAMINGKLRRTTAATTADPTTLDAGDWTDVYLEADDSDSQWDLEFVDSGPTPGGSASVGTNTRLIGSIHWDATTDLDYWIQYRVDKVIGWQWQAGSGTDENVFAATWGVTFALTPLVNATALAAAGAGPNDISSFVNSIDNTAFGTYSEDTTTTTASITAQSEVGTTFAGGANYGMMWVAEGDY